MRRLRAITLTPPHRTTLSLETSVVLQCCTGLRLHASRSHHPRCADRTLDPSGA